ncbi:MAG TPA: ABC transporter permease [Bacteroidales bacterium]|nr:ABC transporter permease [Bacteroidales bacterium]HPY80768.1 ABC transporter permease [Bacteroidales bacterium]HRT13534.1 ABC transporter permease [Bacteroidales bacterium]
MNKTLLIISREYLTRIKKKSFIIMTILGPLLMAALIVVPLYIVHKSEKETHVLVVDDNDYFLNKFTDTKKVFFSYLSGDINDLKKKCISGEYDAVLHILGGIQSNRSNLYYHKEPSLSLRGTIEEQMNKIIFDKSLIDSFNIAPPLFATLKERSQTHIVALQIDEHGNEQKSFTEINRIIGIVAGFLIYFFIFMFASQVLRSVLEEKTNRIVEVLIASVRPIQLMLGKIIGVALVGLTQFALWIVLTIGILGAIQLSTPDFFQLGETTEFVSNIDNQAQLTPADNSIALQKTNILNEINNFYSFSFSTFIIAFFFFFLMGYLLYSTLFAAVGSAVDNETDSQQFLMPVTIPLLLTIILIMPMAEDPNGALAWWFSMIPLTSPIAMLIRIPSGVPLWELLTSMGLLVLFFFFCAWIAAKIYRTGILMYGQKITYRDLFKWIKY